MTVEIIYETHSTTTDNEDGIATGWLPGSLSDAGRAQAKQLGARHRTDGLAAVFTSDLSRAVETAAIAFGDTGVPVYQDARLRECNYGELNGSPASHLNAERARHIHEPYPGGQSYNAVVDQMRDFLRDLSRGWDGRTVLIIAHSANRWALEHLLKGAPLEDIIDAPLHWMPGWRYQLQSK